MQSALALHQALPTSFRPKLEEATLWADLLFADPIWADASFPTEVATDCCRPLYCHICGRPRRGPGRRRHSPRFRTISPCKPSMPATTSTPSAACAAKRAAASALSRRAGSTPSVTTRCWARCCTTRAATRGAGRIRSGLPSSVGLSELAAAGEVPQPPRPDLARARRVPPWGRSERQFMLGQFADTEQVFMGELDPRRALQEGGVVPHAHVLARERGRSDSHVGARHPPPRRAARPACRARPADQGAFRHVCPRQSVAGQSLVERWIDLLRGLTQAGIGKLDEADMLLGRSAVVEGQFDHPLTCVVLLEQGASP